MAEELSVRENSTDLPLVLCSIIQEYTKFRTVELTKWNWEVLKDGKEEYFHPLKKDETSNPVKIEEIKDFQNNISEVLYYYRQDVCMGEDRIHCILKLKNQIYLYYNIIYTYGWENEEEHSIKASRNLNYLLEFEMHQTIKDHFTAFQNYQISEQNLKDALHLKYCKR